MTQHSQAGLETDRGLPESLLLWDSGTSHLPASDPVDSEGTISARERKRRASARRRALGLTQARERARYHAADGRKREQQRVKALGWKARNREKIRVHWITEAALDRGELVRQPCQECGAAPSHAHHADYSRPLEVMWLCALHHMRQHAREGRLAPRGGARASLAGAVRAGKGPRRHDR